MAKNKGKSITVGFVALGCPKNVVDSERMLAEIAQAGYLISADPDSADVVIINTCGFIAPAVEEALDAIKHALRCKKAGSVKKVIAAGCLAQRLGDDLLKQAKGLDAIVGLGQRDDIADIIALTLQPHKNPISCLQHHEKHTADDRTRLRIGPAHTAYLRISEGCDHKCTFCTIPAIRGPFISKKPELILEEAKELVSSGVQEINLIAQDTAYYGKDLKIKDGLTHIIKLLETIPLLRWIRIMYSYPTGITDQLIETIAHSEKTLHYLDIPIQHINNAVLKAMRRPDRKENITALIKNLRNAIPDIAIRTTVIVGFPGETDSQFKELLDFVKWAKFDALGCFKYYPEHGTPAAEMPNQVSEETKEKRIEKLMLAQQKIAFAKNRDKIGKEVTCLVDSIDDLDRPIARSYAQAPEIDSVCIVRNADARIGTFISAKIVDTKDYDLIVDKI